MNKLIPLVIGFLLILQGVHAQIAISSFTSNPEVILPGKEVTVRITLENVGDDDVDDILVKLDLSQAPFAPISSSSEKIIDKLDEDDETIVEFRLVALPDAASQIYKIPVEISYGAITKDALISLNVAGQAKLDVVLESSEVVKIGDKGKVIVKFVNNGLTDIKFLTVKLNAGQGYELLSTDTVYIGQVDVDDFETAEFDILARQKNPGLLFTVTYKDTNNKEYSQSKAVRLTVYTLEEAQQLGLVTSNLLNYIAVPIILLVIGFFWYRRRKRRKLQL